MTYYFSEEKQIRLLGDVYQKHNKVELLINAMHHHREDILQEIEQPKKFSNQVLIDLLYSKTILNG